jgi:hypothetical protein
MRRAKASSRGVERKRNAGIYGVARRLCLTLVLDALLAGPLCAQSQGSVAASLPASTRSAALGGAAVALAGDAGSVFANPAAIATVRRLAVEGSFERYLAGVNHTAAAVAVRAGRLSWGGGLQVLDYGSEAEVIPDPATGNRRGIATGNSFHPVDALAVAALTYRFSLAAVGVAGKYARQDFGGPAADAAAADVGLAIALFDIAAFGASVQNLGGDLGANARLPRRTRVGLTLNYTDPQGSLRLLTTLEGQWERDHAAVLALGVEGGLAAAGVGLVARAGLHTPGAASDASRWTAGAGVVLGGLALDYAYRSWDVLAGGTHRLGIRWKPS